MSSIKPIFHLQLLRVNQPGSSFGEKYLLWNCIAVNFRLNERTERLVSSYRDAMNTGQAMTDLLA